MVPGNASATVGAPSGDERDIQCYAGRGRQSGLLVKSNCRAPLLSVSAGEQASGMEVPQLTDACQRLSPCQDYPPTWRREAGHNIREGDA